MYSYNKSIVNANFAPGAAFWWTLPNTVDRFS